MGAQLVLGVKNLGEIALTFEYNMYCVAFTHFRLFIKGEIDLEPTDEYFVKFVKDIREHSFNLTCTSQYSENGAIALDSNYKREKFYLRDDEHGNGVMFNLYKRLFNIIYFYCIFNLKVMTLFLLLIGKDDLVSSLGEAQYMFVFQTSETGFKEVFLKCNKASPDQEWIKNQFTEKASALATRKISVKQGFVNDDEKWFVYRKGKPVDDAKCYIKF